MFPYCIIAVLCQYCIVYISSQSYGLNKKRKKYFPLKNRKYMENSVIKPTKFLDFTFNIEGKSQ